MSRTRVLGFASSITFISVLFLVLPRLGADEKKDGKENHYRPLGLFTEVLSLVEANYVEPVEMKSLMTGAFSGMTEAMDPFAEYIPPEKIAVFRSAQEASKKEGVVPAGIVLAKRYGYPVVVAAVPGSPAEKAGIKTDDLIEKIGGEPTRALSLWEVDSRLSGKPGGRVSLTVVREGKPRFRTIEYVRASFTPQKPSLSKFQGETVLRIPGFDPGTANTVKELLGPLDPNKAFMIDIRGSATGTFDEAARTAALFVPEGRLGEIRGKKAKTQTFTAATGERVHTGRIVILVDSGTAGAAEFFGAAVRESAGRLRGSVPSPTATVAERPQETPVPAVRKDPEPARVWLVGETTAGMGADFQIIPLESGGALKIAVAKVRTPHGHALSPKGLDPDDRVALVVHDETVSSPTDPVLLQGVKALAAGNPAATKPAS